MKVTTQVFSGNSSIKTYHVEFEEGISVKVSNYGATVLSIAVPDKNGKKEDVVLGFEEIESYFGDHPYFGSLCGRFANRIADGRFEINGQAYQLARNNFNNHLHGGVEGFHRKVWEELGVFEVDGKVVIDLQYVSPHLEEGYPGELVVNIKYVVSDSKIELIYAAETSETTVVNLTDHTYFNLSGILGSSVFDTHHLQINAGNYVPVNANQIPTGSLAPVASTDFDFRIQRPLKYRSLAEGLAGFDHCYALDASTTFQAKLTEEASGRQLTVYTTEPGIQLYTGDGLDGSHMGKGFRFNQYSGLCLETQHFPDSPNFPDFPTTLLQPEEVFQSTTVYDFSQ